MLGLLILLLFNLAGALAHDYLRIPLPGNVIGMLLLLAALSCRIIKLHHVESAANVLLKHMMLLFAPVIVGTLALTKLLAANWLPLLATMILSTLITIAITGAAAAFFKGPPPESAGD